MEIILKYFPDLTDQQKKQFTELQELYGEWNAQINVISRKDIDELYTRHILHSLSIAKYVTFANGTKILDVGTGGGFPGIPLAILFPEVQFYLTDSIGKKIKVVKGITKALGLKNVKSDQIRSEEVKDKFDFVVTRAVASFGQIREWVESKILLDNKANIPNGIICLKGGDLTEELSRYKKRVEVYELSDIFEEEFYETKKIVYWAI